MDYANFSLILGDSCFEQFCNNSAIEMLQSMSEKCSSTGSEQIFQTNSFVHQKAHTLREIRISLKFIEI